VNEGEGTKFWYASRSYSRRDGGQDWATESRRWGVLWIDKGRNSQHHIRSKTSPCSTVVKEEV
jgi:hypothetical protein